MKLLPKVFVVDDDPAVLKSLEALLTTHGYTVKGYTSAEEFLAEHHPTQVGCVLVNLLMPGLRGSELLRRLRESGSQLSVVLISGLIDTTAGQEEESASVPLIDMPYDASTLLTMVEDGVANSLRRRALKGGGTSKQ